MLSMGSPAAPCRPCVTAQAQAAAPAGAYEAGMCGVVAPFEIGVASCPSCRMNYFVKMGCCAPA